MQFKIAVLICITIMISLTIILGFTLAVISKQEVVFIETLGIISAEILTGGIGLLITKRKGE